MNNLLERQTAFSRTKLDTKRSVTSLGFTRATLIESSFTLWEESSDNPLDLFRAKVWACNLFYKWEIQSKRESQAHVNYVPIFNAHHSLLLPIERSRSVIFAVASTPPPKKKQATDFRRSVVLHNLRRCTTPELRKIKSTHLQFRLGSQRNNCKFSICFLNPKNCFKPKMWWRD